MHHVALDRTRPDDRHLHHQVVERRRLEPGQHRHLRPALDLEGAQRVRLADHRVRGGVLGRDAGHVQLLAAVLLEQLERAAHAAQHAQAEHVDLHELQGVDVVLVPLDHLPVGHRRRLDRHQVVQPVLRQHEAARVGAELPRKADQLARQLQRQPQPAVLQVEVQLLGVLLLHPVLRPAPHLAGQHPGHVLGQPHHLADVADRAARLEAHDRAAQRRPVPAVALVDPLDHLLAPLALEVDVDVRRLAPLGRDEPLEQQPGPHRVDRGDAQHVADRGVGGRAAPLAQDVLGAGVADDAVHRQEVGGVLEPLDQRQLVPQLLLTSAGRPSG